MTRCAVQAKLTIRPCTITEAKVYVRAHHRHNRPPVSGLFALSVWDGDRLCGVVMAGRPVARALDNGETVELTRVCVDGTPNAASALIGAGKRAAQALGYRRVITYTLQSEPGTSLRAAGMREAARLAARAPWSAPSRPREAGTVDRQPKIRWEHP